MTSKNIKHFVMAIAVGCGTAAAITACSDKWDNHYDGAASGANVNGGSLWEAIEASPELSNFASVLQATGYDRSLKSSQVFTVFAPTNSTFSQADAQSLIGQYNKEKEANTREEENTVVKEFIKNHLALFNHSVADGRTDTLTTMNGKRHLLNATQFSGVDLTSSNALYGNGVLFTLNKPVAYYPNVFEYVAKDSALSHVRDFLYNELHNRYVFDAASSVPDSIRDGQTVYSDSVLVQENTLFDSDALNALLTSEDSTYWMVLPTNDEWDRLVTKYTPYFNYDKSIQSDLKKGTVDSLAYTNARLAILGGAVFSRKLNTDQMLADSAMSTRAYEYELRQLAWGADSLAYYQYQKPYETVMANTENVACSNGQVMKTDTWNFEPRQTFMRDLIIEAEDNYIKQLEKLTTVSKDKKDTTYTETITQVTRNVSSDNPYYNKISGHTYVEFPQLITTGDTQHGVTFWLPRVLSDVPYDIYVRTVPALAGDTLASEIDRTPVKLKFTLSYLHNGKQRIERIGTVHETQKDSVDMLLVKANHKFTHASYGVKENDAQATLKIETNVRASEVTNRTHQRTMRIDCIILKPHEE